MAYNLHLLAISILILSNSNPSLQLPNFETNPATISAAPALLPEFPYTELSPEIAPLLPSPGGPARPSMPIIPSSRSPNPDTMATVGPDTAAFPPTGPFQESAAVSRGFSRGLGKVEALSGLLGCWLVLCFMI